MLDLDPERLPPPPLDAATVLVVRDARTGRSNASLEVFCVRRHARSAFLGGAVVFPGGKLDDADRDATWLEQATPPHPRTAGFAADADHARALAVCACRETLEEAAIALCTPAVDETTALAWQRLGAEPAAPLSAALRAHGTRLDLAGLLPFARWVTPEAEARRYDTRFFVAVAPPGQQGRHDERETTSSRWSPPAVVLEAFERGQVVLAPPTLRALELLAGVASAGDALALCAAQSLLPICPRFVAEPGPMLVLPGDPLHDVREPRVAGPTRFVLHDGRFVSADPP